MIQTFFPRSIQVTNHGDSSRDMKGKRFADITEAKKKTTEALSGITEDEFKKCFEQWNKRLDKCISASGEYFEGD